MYEAMHSASLIPLSSSKDWNAFIRDIPGSVCHSNEYCKVVSQIHNRVNKTFLFAYENDGGKVACVISVRSIGDSVDIFCPIGNCGFVHSGKIFGWYDAWSSLLRTHSFTTAYVPLSSLAQAKILFEDQALFTKNQWFISRLGGLSDEWLLKKNEEALLSMQSHNWLRTNFRAIYDQERLKRAFIPLYLNFMIKKKVNNSYRLSSTILKKLISLRNSFLIGIEQEGEIIGIHFYLSNSRNADALLSAFSRHEASNRASALLYISAIKHFRSVGVKSLNFGNEIQVGDGLGRFKRGFSNEIKPAFIYKRILDQATFDKSMTELGPKSSDLQYFPPYYKI